MSRQTLGLVGAASLLAGWMLASTANPPVAQTQGAVAPRRAAVPASVPAPPVPSFEALRARLDAAPPAPRARRNPFEFGGRHDDEPDWEAPPAPEPVVDAEPRPAPAVPALRLLGVASSMTDEGLVRTAILSDGRELWMLTVGQTLPDGRAVTRVDDDAVTIDDPDGGVLVIRLR